ncbi:MAG: SRPBCC domain-containing protein [Nocardioidaceae bacterium]|nr:SRPBCC domain-containing protein [Nocardioidaceae bacterium]NUS52759.1 SRPBCC domain-containing protein [Nocardioidaceae bacterium]
MVDILHRIGVVAPLDEVYRAVTTREGLAGWWTVQTDGTGEVGDKLVLRFGDVGGFDMEVLALDPAGHVRWRVVDGPEEWIGTEVDWRLEQREEYTVVLFAHEGWREPVEFMHHCSTKWATFLLSLKELVETGRGRPAPDDVRISDWH